MVSDSPPFWWRKTGWEALALAPFSWIYGAVAARNLRRGARAPLPVPVICVGNFTVGGAGKTPTVIALAKAAKAIGMKPGVLSRGYGGSIDRTTVVDPHHHRARDVGDEPLLIAREALTVIARRRIDGANRLIAEGANLIIMDDGFQSARLHVDYALMVIDARRGIGNGRIVPSGPVRAPTSLQLKYATALLKVGEGVAADPFIRLAARIGKPVMEAKIAPRQADNLDGMRVLAFAGIADPEKFFRTVREIGAEPVATRSFGDHQHLTDDEIEDILSTADSEELQIVTTAKDAVRLIGHHGRAEELARRMQVIDVDMAFDNPQAPTLIVREAVETARRRRAKANKA
ncbi:tetraacyldisaccharide 4'-kinase [Rhizobium sp. SG_E_25_P2]|uniref:tetraacyldisaccharide 4'-kinase n=1 Tax=Rhizobium sp. SG_E_25_P2 TaxID=2879942 RepID=UPI0024732352|nr:tetraacyldisaccharide 4'-kinase [Rhizobium sp. SG_E_25_P2]MDH6264689.1 tetraacyldisaccharide 4'-kinase [Rhizobium sp. SG_E_25_P2]